MIRGAQLAVQDGPDAIEHDPYGGHEEGCRWVCATYKYHGDGVRTGALEFYGADERQVRRERRVEWEPPVGILDVRWAAPETVVVVAGSDGSVWEVQNGKPVADACTRLLYKDEQRARVTLSVEVDRGLDGAGDRCVATFSDGAVGVLHRQRPSLEWYAEQAHAGEVWSCAFHPDAHGILSGADDGYVRGWDVRLASKRASKRLELRPHQGLGVTSLHALSATHFLTGGYDEWLRLWDERCLQQPLAALQLPGGVWRIQCRGTQWLCACMQGGAAAGQWDGDELRLEQVLSMDTDAELVYGVAWLCAREGEKGPACVTSSFYEGTLCLWHNR
ncbi:hypothetical protein CDCA_CDCA10G2929 [Cyanidium caldarium]|uniref:methylated diphthine methylhydrolase n=1 Tax=Cyanidium caldarium TaxID=2771 RepID=A0AAV9IX93_CYACA|nr:hypothetical protein CDCA_CDCA10G2929 [Cyanidium caldarium]